MQNHQSLVEPRKQTFWPLLTLTLHGVKVPDFLSCKMSKPHGRSSSAQGISVKQATCDKALAREALKKFDMFMSEVSLIITSRNIMTKVVELSMCEGKHLKVLTSDM
jgi:hypothetical protein